MKTIDELIDRILDAENILKASKENKYSTKIDISDDSWIEKAKEQSEAFESEHHNLLVKVSDDLLLFFKKAKKSERESIWRTLSDTEYLTKYLNVFNGKINFENQLLMFIIKNLGLDTRDALLELNHLIAVAKTKKIEYKKVIKDLIPFSDDVNRHGMGSMRFFLLNILK